MGNEYRWTVFFLMRAVSGYFDSAIETINEILTARMPKDVVVIICLNIRGKYIPKCFERESSTPDITTVFYRVTSGDKPGRNNLNLIKENTKFNIKDGQDVSDFFKENIPQQHLVSQYILFTWDHGQPFAIFSDDDNSPITDTTEKLNDSRITEKYKPLLTHFRQWDFYQTEVVPFRKSHEKTDLERLIDESKDMLTITELKNAIKSAFGRTKIDVLVLANCNLQFFDTGYELCSCVDYLVAFESFMYFENGLNYKAVLESLTSFSSPSAQKISQLVVTSYELKRRVEAKVPYQDVIDSVALFANDLSWYPLLGKLISELASKLTTEISIHFEKIKAARNRCETIRDTPDKYCLVDFGQFIYALFNELPGIFEGRYSFFVQVLRNVVQASYIGSSLQEDFEKLQRPSCFAVYFPANKGRYVNDFRNTFMDDHTRSATTFVKQFKWDDFITAYVDLNEKRLSQGSVI